jgi:hypothetical protein
MATTGLGSGIGVLRLAFAKPGERSLSMTPKIAWVLNNPAKAVPHPDTPSLKLI